MMGGMVKVAAQERYFQSIGLDVSKLHYTHKLIIRLKDVIAHPNS